MITVLYLLLCLLLCSPLQTPLLYASTHKYSVNIQEQTTDSLSFAMTCRGQHQTDQQVGWFLEGSVYSFQTSSCCESIVSFVRQRLE